MSRWSIPLDKLARKTGNDIERVGRQATSALFRSVAERSPVDTGRFRGNWQFTKDTIPGGTLERDDKDGSLAAAEALKALVTPLGGVTYYTNNLPYAQRLENGYSGQAPAGMVRVSIVEFKDYVRRQLR